MSSRTSGAILVPLLAQRLPQLVGRFGIIQRPPRKRLDLLFGHRLLVAEHHHTLRAKPLNVLHIDCRVGGTHIPDGACNTASASTATATRSANSGRVSATSSARTGTEGGGGFCSPSSSGARSGAD